MRRVLSGRDLSNLDVSDLIYLREQGEENAYADALRALVNDTDILSDRQRINQTEEIFENEDGTRKSVPDLLRSLAGRNLTYSGDRVQDGDALNAATSGDQLRGKYLADVAATNPDPASVGVVQGRVKDAAKWSGDPVLQAYVNPESVSPNETNPQIIRAAIMGSAASQGDRAAVIEANKRYEFTDDEVNEFLRGAKIGGSGFGAQIRKSGLDEGRALEVIDPETGVQVAGTGNREKEFYDQRIHSLTKGWLDGGGTGFLDARSDIAIPGNSFQMEHDYPFSITNPQGRAEVDINRPGFYARYLNSEKAEIDPTTYYQMQRLAALAQDKGIAIDGVLKGSDGTSQLRAMIEKVNPSVTQTGERLIKDRTNIHHPEREAVNETLVREAQKPMTFRKAAQALNDAGITIDPTTNRVSSPGDDKERAIVINSGGGDVTIGENALRKNGNGKH